MLPDASTLLLYPVLNSMTIPGIHHRILQVLGVLLSTAKGWAILKMIDNNSARLVKPVFIFHSIVFAGEVYPYHMLHS